MEQRMFLFFSNARVREEEKYTENHKKTMGALRQNTVDRSTPIVDG
jgi:hypothetical protein